METRGCYGDGIPLSLRYAVSLSVSPDLSGASNRTHENLLPELTPILNNTPGRKKPRKLAGLFCFTYYHLFLILIL